MIKNGCIKIDVFSFNCRPIEFYAIIFQLRTHSSET